MAACRPEKDHAMQLRALEALFREHPEYKNGPSSIRLVLIGGVRNEGDASRVEGLRKLANEIGIAVS
jgi:alpha-1,2-mannosyltransferase